MVLCYLSPASQTGAKAGRGSLSQYRQISGYALHSVQHCTR